MRKNFLCRSFACHHLQQFLCCCIMVLTPAILGARSPPIDSSQPVPSSSLPFFHQFCFYSKWGGRVTIVQRSSKAAVWLTGKDGKKGLRWFGFQKERNSVKPNDGSRWDFLPVEVHQQNNMYKFWNRAGANPNWIRLLRPLILWDSRVYSASLRSVQPLHAAEAKNVHGI